MPENRQCQQCKLHRLTRSVCVYGDGPQQADIMLIGEAPGADEESSRKPFVGPAGKKLNEALAEAGIRREEIYITNSVKCRPPQNRVPEKDELAACLPYLLEEIAAVRPKIIIALGNTALGVLTGEAKDITKRRGKLLTPRKGFRAPARIMATFHPSSCLRPQGASNYARIVEDLRYAKSLVSPQVELASNASKFPPLSDDAAIIEALKGLTETEGRIITVDIEWTAGDNSKDMIWPWSRRGEIFSIAFTGRTPGGDVTVAIAWPVSMTIRKVLARLLANRNIVFHNSMADLLWLIDEGFDVNLAGDTMLLAYLLDETQPRGLDNVAVKYAGVQVYWKDHLYKQRPTGEQWNEILTYNGNDTQVTLDSLHGLARAVRSLPEERRRDITNLHKHLLLPVTKVLARAAYVGVPVDEVKLNEELQATELRYQQAAMELAEYLHTTPQRAMKFANSADDVKQYLHSLGIDVENAQKDTLKLLQEYPVVTVILKVKEEAKLLSTYLRPWAALLKRQGDGRLHSVYRTLTGTGRSSAEATRISGDTGGGGTIQTAPRKPWVRALVKVTPGRLLVSGDFSTVEMRVAAYYSNERTMIQLFQSGVSWNEKGEQIDFDIHRTVAAFIKRQSQGFIALSDFLNARQQFEMLVVKDERQGAKGVNFGLAFGMQEEKLVDYSRNTYGVVMTLEQARFARESYMKLFPALPVWHQWARNNAKITGYSQRTVFGRMRKFEDEADVNAAINTPVQSTANDFAFLAMVQIDELVRREQLDAFVIGYIHDSVMLDCSEKDAPRVKQLLEYVMQNVDTSAFGFTFPIPLPAEVKIGESWAA